MSKYEALKAESKRLNMAIVDLYPDDGSNPENDDVYIAEVAAEKAEATQTRYERKAAEMHDELVETLEEFMYGKPDVDKIRDVIKRAKAI